MAAVAAVVQLSGRNLSWDLPLEVTCGWDEIESANGCTEFRFIAREIVASEYLPPPSVSRLFYVRSAITSERISLIVEMTRSLFEHSCTLSRDHASTRFTLAVRKISIGRTIRHDHRRQFIKRCLDIAKPRILE